MKQLSIKFCKIAGLSFFDKDKWFIWAFSTMQRTNKGGTTKDQRDKIKSLLYDKLYDKTLLIKNQDSFNTWFFDCVNDICKIGKLSFGQGQKIINILLKYFFSFYYSEQDTQFRKEFKHLKQLFPFLHAPIDNIVLVKLKKHFDSADIDFIIIRSDNARFIIASKFIPWSKLNDREVYIKTQKYIRRLVKETDSDNNLHFEMKYLWDRKNK